MKIVGWALFIFCCFIVLNFSLFNRLSEDKAILKVVLTGNEGGEEIEWKSPKEALKRTYLPTYEVRLEKPDGRLVDTFYMYGDLIGIRAKVIRFAPFLNAIGVSNLYQLEAVYNGYRTVDRHNSFPTHARDITLSSIQDGLWNFWERLFVQQCHCSWIKSASLESSYFPLTDLGGKPISKEYLLTITSGGLSSIAFKPEK